MACTCTHSTLKMLYEAMTTFLSRRRVQRNYVTWLRSYAADATRNPVEHITTDDR